MRWATAQSAAAAALTIEKAFALSIPLLATVAEGLVRAVMHDMRWSVKERHGLTSVEPLRAGVFTVVQRFRSDLGLYVHLHCLATDGAFEELGADVRFLPAVTPTPERMMAVLAQVHKAVAAAAENDDLDMDPALSACVQLGLSGPHPAPPPQPVTRPPLTVTAFGMHLHAATTVDGRDRKQLERVCRYMPRGAPLYLWDWSVLFFAIAWRSDARG